MHVNAVVCKKGPKRVSDMLSSFRFFIREQSPQSFTSIFSILGCLLRISVSFARERESEREKERASDLHSLLR